MRGRLRKAAVFLALSGIVAVLVGAALSPGVRGDATPDDFVLGSAEAKADTLSLGVGAGGATIGLTWGRGLAKYQEATGIAEGRALDFGLLKSLLSMTCDDSPPALDPATLPEAARVDSREPGAATSRRNQARMPGAEEPGAVAGLQDARATSQPWAWAGTETVDTNLFLVGLKGGRSEVRTEVVDGTRRATAVVTGTELSVLGGVITLRDPRWEAEATSGAETTSEGHFTFSGATVLGVERSASAAEGDFERFSADIAKATAGLGVHLDYPAVEVEGKRVRVTPMRFALTDPPAGAMYVAPVLEAIQPLRESFVKLFLEQDCNNATVVTVLDIVLSLLGGVGSVDFAVGGVDVSTDDTVYANPFGGGGFGALPAAGSVSTTAQRKATAAASASPPGPATTGDSAADAVEAEPQLDEVANRRFLDGSTGGAALVVGAAALGGAVALAAGDYLVMRRGRRRIPDA